jgi:hypothetical protein
MPYCRGVTLLPSPRVSRLPAPAEVLGGLGLAGLVVAAALPASHIADGPVLCPFRRLTGLPCPGCGLTRSWVYLVHGDVHAAVWANPFGLISVAAALALAVMSVVARVRRRPPLDLERLVRQPWVIALFLAWVGFGLVRIVWILASR